MPPAEDPIERRENVRGHNFKKVTNIIARGRIWELRSLNGMYIQFNRPSLHPSSTQLPRGQKNARLIPAYYPLPLRILWAPMFTKI